MKIVLYSMQAPNKFDVIFKHKIIIEGKEYRNAIDSLCPHYSFYDVQNFTKFFFFSFFSFFFFGAVIKNTHRKLYFVDVRTGCHFRRSLAIVFYYYYYYFTPIVPPPTFNAVWLQLPPQMSYVHTVQIVR